MPASLKKILKKSLKVQKCRKTVNFVPIVIFHIQSPNTKSMSPFPHAHANEADIDKIFGVNAEIMRAQYFPTTVMNPEVFGLSITKEQTQVTSAVSKGQVTVLKNTGLGKQYEHQTEASLTSALPNTLCAFDARSVHEGPSEPSIKTRVYIAFSEIHERAFPHLYSDTAEESDKTINIPYSEIHKGAFHHLHSYSAKKSDRTLNKPKNGIKTIRKKMKLDTKKHKHLNIENLETNFN